ncbi:MAG: glutathione S-transferase family protein [Streptosporangiales bacterium]|nr:glutathione S-transferase family protein [Streptosporangiales bacterium]
MTRRGEWARQANRFTDRIMADGSTAWPVEPGRYRLVVSLACPWAHRSIIVRRLLGLEEAIGLAVVDTVTGLVVTNDFPQISLDLSTQWRAHARPDAPDLYPAELRDEIDDVSTGVYADVNNGVYKAGIATSQDVYEAAFEALFARLDRLSERLATRRYLVGRAISEADVRLFVTLVRFDAVYHGHFKCNRHKLTEMPVLWAYARDLYQTPGFGETVDFDHIKRHYYVTHPQINPSGVVPVGPDPAGWTTPHGREGLR